MADPQTNIDACWNQPGPAATNQWVIYSHFGSSPNVHPLYLDEYTPPPTVPGPYPAAVLAHGGGWVGGCRLWLDGLASHMALDGFIAFNIDYRLSCTDPGVYLCAGVHATVPVQDVQAAMSWTRANAGQYAAFTGKLALMHRTVAFSGSTRLGGFRARLWPFLMASSM